MTVARHCDKGWGEDGKFLARHSTGEFVCEHCHTLYQTLRKRCFCDDCLTIRQKALPAFIDSEIACAYYFGVPRKVAGKLFQGRHFEAAADSQGFVTRQQLLEAGGARKAELLADVARRGAQELDDEAPTEYLRDGDFMSVSVHSFDPKCTACLGIPILRVNFEFFARFYGLLLASLLRSDASPLTESPC
jgi:hypothetical protein